MEKVDLNELKKTIEAGLNYKAEVTLILSICDRPYLTAHIQRTAYLPFNGTAHTESVVLTHIPKIPDLGKKIAKAANIAFLREDGP